MMGIAVVLGLLALVALGVGGFMKHRAGRIDKAPFVRTGELASRGEAVAGEKGAVSVEGAVVCPTPLVAPASGKPCLHYKLTVVGKWKEGDQEKKHTYVEMTDAANFAVDDGSGAVGVAVGKGGDFDIENGFRGKHKEGMFDDLKNALGKGQPVMFGHFAFQNPATSKATEFECVEEILPLYPRLYVNGKAEQGGIVSPKWASLMIKKQSREELLGSAAKWGKMSFIGGGVGMVAAAIVGVIASMTAEEAPAAPPAFAAAPLAAVAPAAATPVPVNPTGAPSSISLAPGFMPDPHTVAGTAGGNVAAGTLDAACNGNLAAAPNHVVTLSGEFSNLRFVVNGGMADTTLVIQKPSGEYVCNDDSEGINPIVEGPFAAGEYRVWVGSYDATQLPAYTLGISELSSTTAASLQ